MDGAVRKNMRIGGKDRAPAEPWHYLIALGSNRHHPRYGLPDAILRSALGALDAAPLQVLDAAPTIHSAPIGPSQRRYANSAAIISARLSPPALLSHLKALEHDFGTRHRRRWSSRILDLDIILWSGGIWTTNTLTIPHPACRERDFVLNPAAKIASQWRDPLTGYSIAQLAKRNNRRRNQAKRLDHSQQRL